MMKKIWGFSILAACCALWQSYIIYTGNSMKHKNYTLSIPRTDLNVTIGKFPLTPAHELEVELKFMPYKDDSLGLLMGEAVLTESEIPGIEQFCLKNGITITALHNHFIYEQPKIMFIHIQKETSLADYNAIAESLKDQLRLQTVPVFVSPQLLLDTKLIDTLLQQSGKENYGIYKIIIDRPDLKITDHHMPMETDSWITLQGSNDEAALAGEIALTSDQVFPFVDALAAYNITLVALHNHMITEHPRIIFVHLWATGPVASLAEGIAVALKVITHKKS